MQQNYNSQEPNCAQPELEAAQTWGAEESKMNRNPDEVMIICKGIWITSSVSFHVISRMRLINHDTNVHVNAAFPGSETVINFCLYVVVESACNVICDIAHK